MPATSSNIPKTSRIDPADLPGSDPRDCVFGSLTPVLAALFPESPQRRETTQRELLAAGFNHPYAWHNLAAVRYLGIVLPFVVFGVLLLLVPPSMEVPLLLSMAVTSVLGWALPRLYVKSRAARRTADIERAMPDLLDMLAMCVGQGLTVHESLKHITGELESASPDLAQELRIVCEQADVGTLQHALENFARRIDSPHVHAFTSMLIQTERMGTSVAEALSESSDAMRERLRQQADETVNKTTFQLLFPTVLCLMPAVFLFLLGPAIVELSNFFGEGGGRSLIEENQRVIERIDQ